MRRIVALSVATGFLLLLPPLIAAQEQQPDRPRSPRMTSDDVSPRGGGDNFAGDAETNLSRTAKSGSAVSNARGLLQGALTRMAAVRSLRTRLQASMGDGTKEVLIENVKPDRMRVVAPDGEIVVVGNTYYYKPAGGEWQVSTSKSALGASVSALDYRAFLEQALSGPGVTITGKILGEEVIDGVETVAYELLVSDSKDSGTVQVWIEKRDGYLRRMFLSGSGMNLRIWLSSINENLTIQTPQM